MVGRSRPSKFDKNGVLAVLGSTIPGAAATDGTGGAHTLGSYVVYLAPKSLRCARRQQ